MSKSPEPPRSPPHEPPGVNRGLIRVPASGLEVIPPASRLDRNPAAVYLGRFPKRSKTTLMAALGELALLAATNRVSVATRDREAFVYAFPWHTLEYQHTMRLHRLMMDLVGEGKLSPASMNVRLSALRGVLKEAWRLGLMTAEDQKRASDFKNLKNKRLPSGRMLTADEMVKLFAAARSTAAVFRHRDSAILAVLFTTGLRRAEVVALDLADYRDGNIRVRHGKGDKERECPVEDAAEELDRWITERGDTPGALFLNHHHTRLTAHSVAFILKKLGQSAGVAAFSPHDLRRTFASTAIGQSKDLFSVQHMLGHESPATTARYDRRGEDAKRAVVAMIKIPR